MARREFRTSYPIWLFASGCMFAALGFVDPLGGAAKGSDTSFWRLAWDLIHEWRPGQFAEAFPGMLFRAALLSVPAALTGWVVQAFVVILFPRLARAGRRPAGSEPVADGQIAIPEPPRPTL